MRKLKELGTFLILAIALNSCAFHAGLMTGNASINDANFTIVDFAIGSSETVKVLGLGGLKSDALVLEAKRNLYENYPIKAGQALANVTVDFKREYYIFWSKLKVIVSAEIVDFNQMENENNPPISALLGIDRNNGQTFFKLGDEVLFLKSVEYEKGKITDINRAELTIQYFDANNRLRTVKQSKLRAYLCGENKRSSEFKFGVGDKVLIAVPSDENGLVSEKKEAAIIGLGPASVLFEYVDNNNSRRKLDLPYRSLEKG